MTTREKIIVGLMCLTILYGAWELIGNRKKSELKAVSNGNPVEQARKFINDFSQKVVVEKGADKYAGIIDQAAKRWSKDPFLLKRDSLKNEKEIEKTARKPPVVQYVPRFVYSGFLRVGDTKLAIINGLEYRVGESLNVDNYYVKSIAPQSVVIARTQGTETIKLRLQESYPK
jgi:hypothetical protein